MRRHVSQETEDGQTLWLHERERERKRIKAEREEKNKKEGENRKGGGRTKMKHCNGHVSSKFSKNIWQEEKNGRGGIRTHAIEMTGA